LEGGGLTPLFLFRLGSPTTLQSVVKPAHFFKSACIRLLKISELQVSAEPIRRRDGSEFAD